MQVPSTVSRYELAKYRVHAVPDVPKPVQARSALCNCCYGTGVTNPYKTQCHICNGHGYIARKD